MILKGIIDEDTVNYKKISMTLEFPYCSFKCGEQACQNYALASEVNIDIGIQDIVNRYVQNPITDAIVFQGLEPFDSVEIGQLVAAFREKTDDDIVIYTGYTEEEIADRLEVLTNYSNIIVKFGRYVSGQDAHFDEVLGVSLASDNQYARRIN